MNNTSPYPSLPQAWGIFGLYIAFSLGVGLLLVIVGEFTGISNLSLINLFGYTITGILILLYIRIRKKSSEPSEAYIRFGTMPVTLTILMLLLTVSVIIVIDPLSNLIPLPEFMEEIFNVILGKSIYNLIVVVIIGPVFEEILLRGIILDGFLRQYSPAKSIFWSSFLFGLLHLNPWQFIGAFIIGLLMGYIYYKTRSLIACIYIHLINNGIGYALSYIYGSEIITLSELFINRRDYLIIYFTSLGVALILLLVLSQVLSRQNELIWKN